MGSSHIIAISDDSRFAGGVFRSCQRFLAGNRKIGYRSFPVTFEELAQPSVTFAENLELKLQACTVCTIEEPFRALGGA